MKTISKAALLGLAVAGLCLTSCETLENRISEHQDMFNSLSASDQALVRAGKIRSGMSMNAVWLAWGSPEQKTSGEMRGRPTETWIYIENRSAPYGSAYYPYYGYGPGFYGGFRAVGLVLAHHQTRVGFFFGALFCPLFFLFLPPPPSLTP